METATSVASMDRSESLNCWQVKLLELRQTSPKSLLGGHARLGVAAGGSGSGARAFELVDATRALRQRRDVVPVASTRAPEEEVRDEARPAGLMRRSEPPAGLGMEVLVKRDEPGKVRPGVQVGAGDGRAGAGGILEEDAGQPGGDRIGDGPEVLLPAGSASDTRPSIRRRETGGSAWSASTMRWLTGNHTGPRQFELPPNRPCRRPHRARSPHVAAMPSMSTLKGRSPVPLGRGRGFHGRRGTPPSSTIRVNTLTTGRPLSGPRTERSRRSPARPVVRRVRAGERELGPVALEPRGPSAQRKPVAGVPAPRARSRWPRK